LERTPARCHIIMIAEPGLWIIRIGRVIIFSAVLAPEPATHYLQASTRDCCQPKHRINRAAEAAADCNCDNCSRERQTDRKYQPVFVDAEPPPCPLSDADLQMCDGER